MWYKARPARRCLSGLTLNRHTYTVTIAWVPLKNGWSIGVCGGLTQTIFRK